MEAANKVVTKNSIEIMEPMFKFLLILYLTLFSISIILLNISDIRPLSYYIAISAIATIVLLEILLYETTGKKVLIILAQIMLLSLNVIWGMTFKYYLYIGRTDLLGHVWYAQNLLQFGNVTEALEIYQAFPLWHILTVGLYLASGLYGSISEIMYLASGLVYLMMPLAVYLVALKLVNDKKLAVIASLVTGMSTVVLVYGMYSIARSVVPILFFVALIALLQRNKGYLFVALFFTFTIVVFHTVSIVFILAILFAIYLLQLLLVKDPAMRLVPGKYLLASVAMTVAYWVLFANTLISVLISNLFVSAPEGVLTKSIIYAPLNELFNYLQYGPYVLFIILGAIIALRSKKCNDIIKTFAILALVLIPLTFPGPLMLINKLMGNFDVERFEEYTFLFMGIMAALGLAVLYYRSSKVVKALIVVLFATWILLSVSNDFVASDNPLVKRPFYTSYVTENEITSIDHIISMNTGLVMSDFVTNRIMGFSPYQAQSSPIKVDDVNKTILTGSKDNIIVIREDELSKRPLKLYASESGTYTPRIDNMHYTYYDSNDPVYDTLGRMNRVYDSNDVQGFD